MAKIIKLESQHLNIKSTNELIEEAQGGSVDSLKTLLKNNLSFVAAVSKEYEGYGLESKDLIDAGNLGMIKAINKFDTNRGFTFLSYAVWWVRQSILQSLSEKTKL
jgi:RNA polymerase primary sigma factor